MNDSALREELIAYGVNVGPINDGTRATYLKVLAKKKTGSPKPSPKPSRTAEAPPSPRKSRTSIASTSPARTYEAPPSPRQTRTSTSSISPTRQARTYEAPPSPKQTRSFEAPTPPRQARTFEVPTFSRPARTSEVPIFPRQARTYEAPPSPKQIRSYEAPASPKTSTPSYEKINFDDDDDHMEFSKYIPRSNLNSSYSSKVGNSSFNRPQNTSHSASFLNTTNKKMVPPKSFQMNATFLVGIAVTVGVIAYLFFPNKVNDGVSSTSNYINAAIMTGFKYAVMPFIVLGCLGAFGFALYYLFQIRAQKAAIHDENKQKMIKEILKAVYNAPSNGIPVKQLRDKMVPAYKRTKAELYLWNECEDFIKTYETRVRAEERASIAGDDIVEMFVWVGSSLIQDFEDE